MKIITITTGDTIFLEIQYHTLNKYVKEHYEFIVFNACVRQKDYSNSYNENAYNDIVNVCENLEIMFLNLFNQEEQFYYDNIDTASSRHAYILRKIVKYMKDNPDEYLMIDSDMFAIDTIDMNDFRKYECAGVLQQSGIVSYLWAGLFYININKCRNLDLLNDFDCGIYNNQRCDTGGGSSMWLNSLTSNIPEPKKIRYEEIDKFNNNGVKFIKHLWSCSWDKSEYPSNLNKNILQYCIEDVRNVDNKYFCEIYDEKFFHFRAGSNWLNHNIESMKIIKNKLKDIMIDILSIT